MFVQEFENLYYQRRMDRLHFCRPCLHTLLHTAPEATCVGPGVCSSQFVMERAIGDLGGEIWQPSNIFGNLCQIALHRSQLNALKAACPELNCATNNIPKFAHDCGTGFIFLRPRDRYRKSLSGSQLTTVSQDLNLKSLQRWGRLCLPNGQIVRSIRPVTSPSMRAHDIWMGAVDRQTSISEFKLAGRSLFHPPS